MPFFPLFSILSKDRAIGFGYLLIETFSSYIGSDKFSSGCFIKTASWLNVYSLGTYTRLI